MNARLDLPFDQYSRQNITADLVGVIRPKGKTLKVLDVGGYKGKTHDFSRQDKVTVLDVFDVEEDNYVKGDGTKMSFKNEEFDVVVSFDVLEHISTEKRADFILECIRVSKEGFFLCCPFENSSSVVTEAEKNLNALFKSFEGKGHQWLAEHIDNVLPTQQKIESVIHSKKLYFSKLYSNKVENWVTMQTIFFLSSVLDTTSMKAGEINRFYNENTKLLDSDVDEFNSYRVIYFISGNQSKVRRVAKAMDEYYPKVATKTVSVVNKLPLALTEIVKNAIDNQKNSMQHSINLLSLQVQTLEASNTAMQRSLSWKVTKLLRATKRVIKRKK